MLQKISLLSLVTSVMLLTACSSVNTKATEDFAVRTETNIHQAENIGADEYAPVALRSAKQNLDAAKAKIAAEEYEQAQQLLEKAAVDADYASVKTHSEKTQEAARQIQLDIKTLESQINPS